MLAYGGFILSHTSKPIHLPPQELVDEFLPPPPEKGWDHVFIDPDRPMMHGNLIMPNTNPGFQEFRMKIHVAQLEAKKRIIKVTEEFKEKFGRDYGNGLFVEYKCQDAEFIMINYGVLAKQMELAVDKLRNEGFKVGLLRLRTYRPFPADEIVQAVSKAKIVGVVDRSTAFGSPTGGPVSTEVRAALHNNKKTKNLNVIPFINGIGGRDVLVKEQLEQFKILIDSYDKGEPVMHGDFVEGTYWTGVGKNQMGGRN